jgi:uncharacterized membrane protein YdbT with pleckstrin-like domain
LLQVHPENLQGHLQLLLHHHDQERNEVEVPEGKESVTLRYMNEVVKGPRLLEEMWSPTIALKAVLPKYLTVRKLLKMAWFVDDLKRNFKYSVIVADIWTFIYLLITFVLGNFSS